MKLLFQFLAGILLLCTIPHQLFSQCAGGAAISTITYDTLTIGNGSNSSTFSFPKFDPALGTLMSADLKSVVGVAYNYTLENQGLVNRTYKIKIQRTDDISSTALDPFTVSALNQTPYVITPVLAPSQKFNSGPKYLNYTVANSVSDGRVVNFMGVGNVDFDYEGGTSASVIGIAPFGLNFVSVTDTIHFSITYRYCPASVLSANLLFFTATPQTGKVLLNWRQMNPEANRQYDVQVSIDGRNYTNVALVAENTAGTYSYTYLNNAAVKLYFRIQQKNVSGEIKYSNIQMIDPALVKNSVRVYPTLFTGGSIKFDFPERGDWRVSLYGLDGKKMTESRQTDVYNAQIELPAVVSNGVYSAEIINMKTQQKQFTRIVVHR